MVIAIYEDKVKKLKQAEALLFAKLDEQGSGDDVEKIKEYFHVERQILL